MTIAMTRHRANVAYWPGPAWRSQYTSLKLFVPRIVT